MNTAKKRTPCEVYSRVVGYIRPVQQWNAGKLEEWKQRKTFKEKKSRKLKIFYTSKIGN